MRFSCKKTDKDRRTLDYYTKDFLNKYFENGIMPNYDVYSITNKTQDLINEDNRVDNKLFYQIHFRGSKIDNYAIFYIKWNNDKIDDIEYYIVPDDKMDLSYEEMYQLAFND